FALIVREFDGSGRDSRHRAIATLEHLVNPVWTIHAGAQRAAVERRRLQRRLRNAHEWKNAVAMLKVLGVLQMCVDSLLDRLVKFRRSGNVVDHRVWERSLRDATPGAVFLDRPVDRQKFIDRRARSEDGGQVEE